MQAIFSKPRLIFDNAIPLFVLIVLGSFGTIAGLVEVAAAQEPTTLLPSSEPLDLQVLEKQTATQQMSVITAKTISQVGLTIPSLWWAQEQFGGKLLENWLAHPAQGERPARVDLIVNRQLWSLLDYLERYQFVNQFGTTASGYGYNTRIFNRRGNLLAGYTCNFSALVQPNCNIILDSAGWDTLRDGF